MGLSRRDLIRVAGAGTVPLAGCVAGDVGDDGSAPTVGDTPNIVFIMADDLGYGDVGHLNPASTIPTPAMDGIAGDGVVCTDAHAGAAVCTPTRYGLLTGRYAWRDYPDGGVGHAGTDPMIAAEQTTLGGLLRTAGYHTACIGKWHLGLDIPRTNGGSIDPTGMVTGGPVDRGFEYGFITPGSQRKPPHTFLENRRYTTKPTTTIGSSVYDVDPGAGAPGFAFEDILPRLTTEATDYVDRAAERDGPFFLYFAISAPHTPIAIADFARGRTDAGPYGDFVWETDWAIGQVRDRLAAHGVLDDTLVIVTSDNGSPARCCPSTATGTVEERFGHSPNAPWRGYKAQIYEGGHRVPFLARWPGEIPAGVESSATFALEDTIAMVENLTGASLWPDTATDSYDATAALLDPERAEKLRPALVHSPQGARQFVALRDGAWKFIPYRHKGGWGVETETETVVGDPDGQLFNLAVDPDESRNVYAARPAVVRRLSQRLERIVEHGHREG